jgi:hypothetical protein
MAARARSLQRASSRTRAGVDKSTRRAAEWVADNLAEFAVSGPEVVAGKVTVAARP